MSRQTKHRREYQRVYRLFRNTDPTTRRALLWRFFHAPRRERLMQERQRVSAA